MEKPRRWMDTELLLGDRAEEQNLGVCECSRSLDVHVYI